MVSELHRMGYQNLRIMPYEYPLAWRLTIAPKRIFAIRNGAFVPRGDTDFPTYSSASENAYFGWRDTKNDDARGLAEKFIERFPKIAEQGQGRDWEYSGWLSELVGFLEGGDWLPVVLSENLPTEPYSLRNLPIFDYGDGRGQDFPLPPPGLLDDNSPEYFGQHEEYSGFLAAGLSLAMQPNYLGSPEVVSKAVSQYFQARVDKYAQRISYQDLLQEEAKIAAIFSGENPDFTIMPGWHTAEALGKAIVTYFNLDADYCEGEALSFILSEGFAAVGLQIGELLEGFQQDEAAEWERDALPQLVELHQFVNSVLMGTNQLVVPDKKLKDYTWRAITP